MNKFIYAIGIAVAATVSANTKVESHQAKSKPETIKQVNKLTAPSQPDSLQLDVQPQ